MWHASPKQRALSTSFCFLKCAHAPKLGPPATGERQNKALLCMWEVMFVRRVLIFYYCLWKIKWNIQKCLLILLIFFKKPVSSRLCFLSQAIYKADLEWLRGIGWMPDGSPEVLRVKNAQEILRDSVYRTPVVNLKYTSIVDTPEVVLAKSNAENISIVSTIFSIIKLG